MRHLIAAGFVLVFLSGSAAAQDDRARLTDRAAQDREIVYFLQAPETHAFRLYHDYTESKEGVDKYVNVVRKGSTASKPSAVLLDTGEPLPTETLQGEEIRAREASTSARGSARIPRPSSSGSRPSRRAARCGSGSRRRTRTRRATGWTATSSCSIALSGVRATPWCCRRAGI